MHKITANGTASNTKFVSCFRWSIHQRRGKYSTVQYSTVQYSTVEYSTVQYIVTTNICLKAVCQYEIIIWDYKWGKYYGAVQLSFTLNRTSEINYYAHDCTFCLLCQSVGFGTSTDFRRVVKFDLHFGTFQNILPPVFRSAWCLNCPLLSLCHASQFCTFRTVRPS